jgi:hypothetical protein
MTTLDDSKNQRSCDVDQDFTVVFKVAFRYQLCRK